MNEAYCMDCMDTLRQMPDKFLDCDENEELGI